jgi:peptidoglycan/xylan/chitin deacetylase (PgdA/CDA1 family)
MQNSTKSNSQKSLARRKKWVAITMAGLLILGLTSVAIIKTVVENREPPIIVVRIDDIQDFAFREAQLFLLNESAINDVPLSLAVITGMFGEDREVVQTVKSSVSLGSEIAVHGWKHEDLAELSFGEQVALLSQSTSRINEILDYDTRVLVPPMFSLSKDTVAAMNEEGYNIISTITDYAEPCLMSEVISLPATVKLSDYSNGTWKMKTLDSVVAEVSSSIQKYGYAIIVTHPQEFTADGKLNPVTTELYRSLLKTLKGDYSFKTLETLGENWSR